MGFVYSFRLRLRLRGKFKVGFKYVGSIVHSDKLESIYIKYHDISKRKLAWTIWEKKSGDYCSYRDFKENWNPETSILKEIKERFGTRNGKEIYSEVDKLVHRNNPFGFNKNVSGGGNGNGNNKYLKANQGGIESQWPNSKRAKWPSFSHPKITNRWNLS